MERYVIFVDYIFNSAIKAIIPILTSRFNTFLMKSLQVLSLEIDKMILKFIKEAKRPIIPKETFKKKSVGKFILPCFKIYNNAILIKIFRKETYCPMKRKSNGVQEYGQ